MSEPNKVLETAKENPLLKLDIVLMYLYTNDTYMHTLDEIQQGVEEQIGSDDNEIALILKKLEKDEYIMIEAIPMFDKSGTIPNTRYENKFNITFNGKIFSKQGGYYLEDIRFSVESKKLETLKSDQIKRDESLKTLTFWIAVGALVAALYYSIESYKELHLFAHHHGIYWRWETITNSKKK